MPGAATPTPNRRSPWRGTAFYVDHRDLADHPARLEPPTRRPWRTTWYEHRVGVSPIAQITPGIGTGERLMTSACAAGLPAPVGDEYRRVACPHWVRRARATRSSQRATR